MVSTRRGMDGREASSFGSGVATVSAHIVCLAKGGSGKGCLASKALEAVAIFGTVGRPLAVVLMMVIVWYLGGAALRCGRWVHKVRY